MTLLIDYTMEGPDQIIVLTEDDSEIHFRTGTVQAEMKPDGSVNLYVDYEPSRIVRPSRLGS